MAANCHITLESNGDGIYAGQLVHGNVQLTLPTETTVCQLYINIYGYAQRILESNKNRFKQVYIDETIYFVGGPKEAGLGIVLMRIKYFQN